MQKKPISPQVKLNIIIALEAEARPIIQALKLKKDVLVKQFQVYHNVDKSICLIISGVGTINGAIATSFIAMYSPLEEQGFLNLGIAGAKNLDIQQLFVVNKLCNATTQRAFYPKFHLLNKLFSTGLITHEKAVDNYPDDAMVDMEAYGIYQAAMKFTSQEFIQVLKVISDNASYATKHINSTFVAECILVNMEKIENTISQMLSLLSVETKQPCVLYEDLVRTHHFTQQQGQQLNRLLERAKLFLPETTIYKSIQSETSSKAILKKLKAHLEGCY